MIKERRIKNKKINKRVEGRRKYNLYLLSLPFML